MNDYLTKKKHFQNRLEILKDLRSKRETEWKEEIMYLSPDSGSFDDPSSDKWNKKEPYYKLNINTLPSFYLKNLATALVSNLTPSRVKWFNLSVDDETREESIWLTNCVKKMFTLFGNAGLYEHLYNTYLESAVFGPNVLGMQGDINKVYDFVPMTIGEFWLAEGENGLVNTVYRRFAMSNIQLYERFGEDNLPKKIKDELARDNTECFHNVIHAIEPNPRYLPRWDNQFNKPYISAYYLEDECADEFLEYKGMSYFPFLVARWDKVGGSVYGNGIGRFILGDVKSLQAYERDLARASKKRISPPLKGSLEMKNAVKDISAEGITYTNDPDGFTALYQVNYDTGEALNNITRIAQRIYSQTYNDLFYALLNKDKTMSATEASGIEQEKLTMLGSVVDRLQNEFLTPLVQGAFLIGLEAGEFGQMPQSLIGKELKIRYQSLLSMAQELSDLTNVERYLQFTASAGSLNTDALKKPDMLKIMDYYAQHLGLDLTLVKTNDTVNQEKEAEMLAQQQAMQQQQQMEALQAGAKAAKDYADAQTISGGAIEDLLG